MARIAHWAVADPTGKRHDVSVDRTLLGQRRVVFDKRPVPRFDRAAEGDRHVFSIAGHLATVVVPSTSTDQPTLAIDGRTVLGSETALTGIAPAPAGLAGSVISAEEWNRHQLLQRRNNGGSWFYWIGGASIVNSLLYAARIEWALIIGLGITQIIDGVAIALSETVRTPVYAILIDIVVASGFLLLGRAARRGRLGIYALGIVLYGLDGLLFIWAEDWLALGFHVFAMFALISGLRAGFALRRIDRAEPAPALTS